MDAVSRTQLDSYGIDRNFLEIEETLTSFLDKLKQAQEQHERLHELESSRRTDHNANKHWIGTFWQSLASGQTRGSVSVWWSPTIRARLLSGGQSLTARNNAVMAQTRLWEYGTVNAKI